jgi:hypothetical protein
MGWTEIYREKDWHRVFEDKATNRLALVDNSGPTPETCEAGLLVIDKQSFAYKGIRIHMSGSQETYEGFLVGTVRCLDVGRDEFFDINVSVRCALFLTEKLEAPPMRLELPHGSGTQRYKDEFGEFKCRRLYDNPTFYLVKRGDEEVMR